MITQVVRTTFGIIYRITHQAAPLIRKHCVRCLLSMTGARAIAYRHDTTFSFIRSFVYAVFITLNGYTSYIAKMITVFIQ